MLRNAFVALCVLLQIVSVTALKQCLCKEIEECVEKAKQATETCSKKCRNEASKMAGDVDAMMKCVKQLQDQIQNSVECIRGEYPNACAKDKPIELKENSQQKLITVIGKRIGLNLLKSGVYADGQKFYKDNENFFKCIQLCTWELECASTAECTLDLQPEAKFIKVGRSCIKSNGFDNAGLQSICSCFKAAGADELEQMCDKILLID